MFDLKTVNIRNVLGPKRFGSVQKKDQNRNMFLFLMKMKKFMSKVALSSLSDSYLR